MSEPNRCDLVPNIDASTTAVLFGGLVSNAPIWLEKHAGIISVNTQARRLGCLIFLQGEVASGRKIESLLLSMPASAIAGLNENIRENGYNSGQLSKDSSVGHYLETAIQLRLLAKQGAVFSLTNKGRFLTDVIQPNCAKPYPLADSVQIFFLDLLLRTDFLGVMTVLRLLLSDVNTLTELQEKYREELLHHLDRVVRNTIDSRLRRVAQDRLLTIRSWRKPESYAEHLVPAKLNWLIDLGIVCPNSRQRYQVTAKHRQWIENAAGITVPTEADLVAFTMRYALTFCQVARIPSADACFLLNSAFAQLATGTTLMKVRCADLLMYLLCFHANALLEHNATSMPLFPGPTVECAGKTYRFTLGSRPTQSYVVCTQKGRISAC